MVWMSDSFVNASPANAEAFHNLVKLKEGDPVISHTSIFDSVLGCLGYQSPDGGIDQTNSICSNTYTPYPITYPSGGAYNGKEFRYTRKRDKVATPEQ